MNNIKISPSSSTYLEAIDLLTATTPFYHIDRIAPFNVLIYVISGCIYVSEEETDYEINEGELILLKEGLHEYGTKPVLAGTSWIYAHFHSYDYQKNNFSDNICVLPKVIRNIKNTDIEAELYRIMNTYNASAPLGEIKAANQLQSFFIKLYEYDKPKAVPKLSDQIIDYLSLNLTKQLSSTDIEDYFHLSYKYLSRVFKEETSTSIMQYHTNLRLEECAKLLRSTTNTISQICESYGYNDQLYFSRIFKKNYGISPREYRRKSLLI